MIMIRDIKSKWLIALIVGILLLVLLGLVFSGQVKVLARQTIPTKYYSTPPDPYAEIIASLQADATRDPEKYEKRLGIAEREATTVAEGRKHIPATPLPKELIEATLQSMEHERLTGTIHYIPYPFSQFKEENAWSEKIGDGYVTVFAGSRVDDPDQGMVIVTFEHGKNIQSRIIRTPSRIGTVRIVRVVGLRLVLEAANGDELYFDAPGERFVNSLNEIVPTATYFSTGIGLTPPPTSIPYP